MHWGPRGIKRFGWRWLASCVVVSVAVLSLASTAAAMTVNTTNDETTPGDAACSLREAIVSATSNTIGGDCSRANGDNDVTLPAGHYVLAPALGELLFAASSATVVITGADPNNPSATNIDAAGTPAIPRRVIEVATGGKAMLQNVEISGGLSASGVAGASAGQSGTRGADGGGILNNSNGALTLDHVLVTDNFTGSGGDGANAAPDGKNAGGGNAGGSGGAIYNATNAFLSITASTITGNGTGDGGDGGTGSQGVNCIGHFPNGGDGGPGAYGGSGGGIYNSGSATITTSTVSANFNGAGGVGGNGGLGAGWKSCPNPTPGGPDIVFGGGNGGFGGFGGNGSYASPNSCRGCAYDLVVQAGGGGIANIGTGTLAISASTISGNHTGAGGMGGASGVPGQDQNGDFNDGEPGGDGGSAGIGGGLLVNNGTQTTTLTNVTIQGNFTGNGAVGGSGYNGDTGLGGGRGGYGGDGGGFWSTGANNSGNTVLLKHVTIAQNGLGAGGAGGAFSDTPVPGIRGRGAAVNVGGRTNPAQGAYGVGFINTLVASNGNPGLGDVNCVQHYDPSQYVDLKDLGHNVSYPENSCPGTVANPLLGPLQDNGGLTFTMVPATGSSAINAVPAGSCTVNVDQRGVQRPGPSKTSCDAGAVETGLTTPTQLSVSKAGSGTGTVTSSPAGINCGATCSALYEAGQAVTLTATPSAGSSFTAWSGACSGSGPCTVTLDTAKSVTATFANNDVSPPDTTITSGPANGSTTTDSTPTFSFSSTETASTFECRVDSAVFAPCSSPGPGSTGSHTTAALSDGPHTFYVRAKDAANNVDGTPASRSFTVDTTPTPTAGGPPATAPTPPPPGPTGKRAAAKKKCKKKTGKARANCLKKAKKLPV
jgi:CSLREA domain-containing protein